jgi:hypothetical protein
MKSYLVEYKVYGFYGSFKNYVEGDSEAAAANTVKAAKLKALATVERIVNISAAEIPDNHPYYDSFGFLRAARTFSEELINNIQYGY